MVLGLKSNFMPAVLNSSGKGLDPSKNTALTHLYCSTNKLTSLDISKNPKLEWVGCSYNQLTALNAGNNPALWSLSLSDNQLSFRALSDLFETLHENDMFYELTGARFNRTIVVSNNPGFNYHNFSNATAKGWMVK
ncbi:MAG: hypothetical protein LBU89_11930 [Fibromonadaceae bacterium]|jgi:hypothetical protein|nr:hypothetical protein [Fibromonadaceae bacterium]